MRGGAQPLFGAVLIASLGGPLRAWALPVDAPLDQRALGPQSPELELAQEQIESGDFEEAVKTLQAGLSQPDLTDDQLVELYRLLGLAQLYLGNEEKAREAFEKLLQARPDFELPRSEPPKIRTLYTRIKEDIKKRRVRPVLITAEPLRDVAGDRAIVIGTRIENLALGARAKLYYRRAGRQSYSSIDLGRQKSAKDQFSGTLPAFEVPAEARAYEMHYYLEVADAAQRRLAGKGDAFNPLTFKVLPIASEGGPVVEGKPWYKNPLIWVGAGVVAAGATAGVIGVATSRQTGSLPINIKLEGGP